MEWDKNLNFSTKAEVEKFQHDLNNYQLSIDQEASPFHWVDLADTWTNCMKLENGGKIFACSLDLCLNITALEILLIRLVRTSSRLRAEAFSSTTVAFERYEINSTYVIKYRAIYDKLMGLWILIFAPNEYDRYCSAKSRKKKFVTVFSKLDDQLGSFAANLAKSIGDFDDKFRTQEIHGTGSVRKWNFELNENVEGNQATMYWAWNKLHPLLTATGNLLNSLGK